jgi:hypothetical protein
MKNFKFVLFAALIAISVALCFEWATKRKRKRKARSGREKGKGVAGRPAQSCSVAPLAPVSPASFAAPVSPASFAAPVSQAFFAQLPSAQLPSNPASAQLPSPASPVSPMISPKTVSPLEEGRRIIAPLVRTEVSDTSLSSGLESAILGARAALRNASSTVTTVLATSPAPAPARPLASPTALRYDPSEFGDDTLRRLASLLDAFSVGGDWSALLAMGDVYRSGDFPRWLPGDDSALRIYMACAGCPDGDVAALGAQRYVEARLDRVTAEDRRGAELPTRFAEEGVRRAREIVLTVPFSAWTTPAWRQNSAGSAGGARRSERPLGSGSQTALGASRTVVLPSAPASTLRSGRPSSQGMSAIVAARPRRPEEELGGVAEHGRPPAGAERGRANRSDGQNVHDHGISSTLKENAKRILESAADWLGPAGVSAALDAATDAVLVSDRDEGTKANALRVLDDLRLPRSAALHSQINASAPQVLAAVWRIVEKAAPAGSERRADLGNVLCSQLASAIEKNLPVCLTGKISRILGVLDGQEDVTSALGLRVAMPMWVVRQELAALASKVRAEAEAASDSVADGGAAEEGDGGEAEFRRRAHAEYVEKLGLSEKVLAPVVDEYAQGF